MILVGAEYNSRYHKLVYLMAKLCTGDKHEIPLRHVENSVVILEKMNKDLFPYYPSIIGNSLYLPDFLDDINHLYDFGYLTVTSRRNEGEWFDYFIKIADKELIINTLSGISPEIDEFIEGKYLPECLRSKDFCKLLELT